MKIVVVPDSCDMGTSSSQKGKLFESFTKDVLLKHNCQVERVQFVPKDADVWAFEIVSKTPVMMECKAGETPVKKEVVASFYGDFKIAQGERPNIVGILMATSGFTAQTADSARAYYKKIPEAEKSFFLYDSIDMISLLSDQGKLKHPRELEEVIQRATRLETGLWTLLVTSAGRFWLVELGHEPPKFLLLHPTGDLVELAEVGKLPADSLNHLFPDVMARLGNADYADSEVLRRVAPLREATEVVPVLRALDKHERLTNELEAICREARHVVFSHLPDQFVDYSLEPLTITFADLICSHPAIAHGALPGANDSKPEDLAAFLGALRLSALFFSSAMLDPQHRGVLGLPAEFSEQVVKRAQVRSPWVNELSARIQGIIQCVQATVEGFRSASPQSETDLRALDILGALSLHLAASYGPRCDLYRSVFHEDRLPDEIPSLSGLLTRFERAWIDSEAQSLRVTIHATTPRAHRSMRVNIGLLHSVLEQIEDLLDRTGSRLPFTRVRTHMETPGFEVMECHFELEADRVLKILMGEELYGTPNVWMRELLQNSIDATQLRRTLFSEPEYSPLITIEYDAATLRVVITDNGIGMSLHQVRKFFSKIGRSYYRSVELEDELRRRGKDFAPISKFGIGFLSVFMIAESAEIETHSIFEKDEVQGLRIYIPAIMEDFYIRSVPRSEPGTKVTLRLRSTLSKSLLELVQQYLLSTSQEVLLEDCGHVTRLPVDERLSVSPQVVDLGAFAEHIDVLTIQASYEFGECAFALPIPRSRFGKDLRSQKEHWDSLPSSRIAVGQAGIFVSNYDQLLGKRHSVGDMYFPYFSRIYGLINLRPDAFKLGVSRNELVLDDGTKARLREAILEKLLNALSERLAQLAATGNTPEALSDIVKGVAFSVVEDGQRYYWAGIHEEAVRCQGPFRISWASPAGVSPLRRGLRPRGLGASSPQEIGDCAPVSLVIRVWTNRVPRIHSDSTKRTRRTRRTRQTRYAGGSNNVAFERRLT